MKSETIAEKCGWNLDKLVKTLSAIILFKARGQISKNELRDTCIEEYAKCIDDKCIIDITDEDFSNIVKDYSNIVGEILPSILSDLSLGEISKLLQVFLDLNVLEFSDTVNNNVLKEDIENEPKSLQAYINEQIGTLLYASGNYSAASTRFKRASKLYREAGIEDRALFLEAFSKIAEAEELKNMAEKLHDEEKHGEEENILKRASRLYAESSALFKKCSSTMPEALPNSILSMADALEVLGNYYFTHGMIEEAEKYFTLCSDEVRRSKIGIPEEHRRIIELKERSCRAMSKICRAMIENSATLYEEAGDDFRELARSGYAPDIMVELASIAYKSAIELSQTLDDILRIYPKYIELVVEFIDSRVRGKYTTFKDLIRDLRIRPLNVISNELKVDEYALKIYIVFKLIEEDISRESIPMILDLLTLIAGLGLDPLLTTSQDLKFEVERSKTEFNRDYLNKLCELLDIAQRKLREIGLSV